MPLTLSQIFHAKCSNAAGCAAASRQHVSIDVDGAKILVTKGFRYALLHVEEFLPQNANAAEQCPPRQRAPHMESAFLLMKPVCAQWS
jgi:hypothetical protein